MSRSILLVLALAPFAAAACASSEAAPSTATKTAQPASTTGDLQTVCVDAFTRNRTCTDDYIPALVDSRAKLDTPPGIAEKVKADRAAVIAQAMAEWKEDSTDANIARNCQAMTAHMDPAGQRHVDEAKACLAKTDCAAYVACLTPVQEAMMAQRSHP